ncbi:MAG: helix-turn-helix transcriptional regulator [Adlercreutzia sp.]|nr:helix-turn-helix transcriptional regulator [Adlercreutzia sp.]
MGKPSLLRSTVFQPLSWAGAFIFTASESTLLYPATSLAPGMASMLGSDFAGQVFVALLCLGVFTVDDRVSRLLARVSTCGVLGVLGLVFLVGTMAAGGTMPVAVAVSSLGIQASGMGLTLAFLVRLMQQPMGRVRVVVVSSAVINAVLVALMELFPFGVTSLCFVGGAGSLGLSGEGGNPAACGVSSKRALRDLRAPVSLALGFFVVAMSFGFLQTLLYQQDQGVVSFVVVGTKLCAVLLFAAMVFWLNDTSYATLAKVIITLAAASFLVFLAQGSYSPMASVFMATGYSLLELTTLLLLADLAACARWKPLRLFAAFYFIETMGYALGCLLLGVALGVDPYLLRLVAVVLSLMLLVCAVWVFNEKQVNALMWDAFGGGSGVRAGAAVEGKSRFVDQLEGVQVASASEAADVAAASDAMPIEPQNVSVEAERRAAEGADAAAESHRPLSFQECVALAAARYRLTERETEVLELFSAGRSASFISELMFVTTNTVRSHIKHIYAKCDVHSRQELITLIESFRG